MQPRGSREAAEMRLAEDVAVAEDVQRPLAHPIEERLALCGGRVAIEVGGGDAGLRQPSREQV